MKQLAHSLQFSLKSRGIKYMYTSVSRIPTLSKHNHPRTWSLVTCLPWRLAAPDPPVASTARYALNITWDSDRSAAVLDHRDHRPLYRLSTVTVETLGAHHTDGTGIYDGERKAWQPWGGGGPGFALTYYRDILSRRKNAIPGATATLNYTLTWRMYNETPSLSFSSGFPSAEPDDPADRDERCIGKRRTMRLILSRISRELDRNAWPNTSRQSRWNVRMFGVRHTIRLWLCYTIR